MSTLFGKNGTQGRKLYLISTRNPTGTGTETEKKRLSVFQYNNGRIL